MDLPEGGHLVIPETLEEAEVALEEELERVAQVLGKTEGRSRAQVLRAVTTFLGSLVQAVDELEEELE